ncbi:MAG: DNA-processing protein DprA [bacterium]
MFSRKKMTEKERLKWIEFSLAKGITQPDLSLLYKFKRDPFEIEEMDIEELKNVMGNRADNLRNPRTKVSEEVHRMEKAGARAVFPVDEEYPALLKEIPNPPLFLRVRGKIPANAERMIAVVGTRRASSYGRRICEYFSEEIAGRNFTVVSGLARGIDTVAHSVAVKSASGTVAVLGCGADVIYPGENKLLAEKIISNGAIVSEYPMGTIPSKQNFPVRNRIISGMSCGVLVVEAPQKSGALITSSFAGDQGRDVWVACGDIFDKNFKGSHALIKDGAKLCESIEDIMCELNLPGIEPMPKAPATAPSPEGSGEKKIYSCIGWKPITLDEIKEKSGLEIAEIFKTLTNLQINGFIDNSAGGKFVRKK